MDQAASLPAPRCQKVAGYAEALRPSCRALVACWAVVGTVGCGYLFVSSTLPVTTLGEPPLWGPGWLSSIAVMAAIVLGLPWLGLPLILLPIGLVHLRRGAPGRLHWQNRLDHPDGGRSSDRSHAGIRFRRPSPRRGLPRPGGSWLDLAHRVGGLPCDRHGNADSPRPRRASVGPAPPAQLVHTCA